MPKATTPPLRLELVKHRYQVCEFCWYNRYGGEGRQPERVYGNVRDECPCAICGRPTDSGHYMPLADSEVFTSVPIVFRDGPRAGDGDVEARMCVRIYDTFDHAEPPAAVRYDLELIGGELYATVAAVQREDELHGDGIIRS
jgi:hypothetical protein